MTYRWLRNDEVSRQVLRLRGENLSDYFRVLERLVEDPRSKALRAQPVVWAAWPDAWSVTFGNKGELVYRILEEDPPALKPLFLGPPIAPD